MGREGWFHWYICIYLLISIKMYRYVKQWKNVSEWSNEQTLDVYQMVNYWAWGGAPVSKGGDGSGSANDSHWSYFYRISGPLEKGNIPFICHFSWRQHESLQLLLNYNKYIWRNRGEGALGKDCPWYSCRELRWRNRNSSSYWWWMVVYTVTGRVRRALLCSGGTKLLCTQLYCMSYVVFSFCVCFYMGNKWLTLNCGHLWNRIDIPLNPVHCESKSNSRMCNL